MSEIMIVNNQLVEQVKTRLANIEHHIDLLETEKKRIMDSIKLGMEQYGIKKIDTDLFSISYIETTTRTTLDQKKLKEQFEEVYLECVKETVVGSSIRLKLK